MNMAKLGIVSCSLKTQESFVTNRKIKIFWLIRYTLCVTSNVDSAYYR